MSTTFNLDAWFRDFRSIAVLTPPGALFGVLKRSFELPGAFAARTVRRDGAQQMYAPGADVSGDDVTEVMFARTTPFDIALDIPQLTASDRYLCDAHVAARLRVLPERREFDAFQAKVMGSQTAVDIAAVENYVRPAVDQALRDFVEQHSAGDLVDGRVSDACIAAVTDALQGPCFAGGLAVETGPAVRFRSPEYDKVRQAEQHAARSLDEHEAQTQLRDALAAAQTARLDHLEAMLSRLEGLAHASPDVELPELMKAFTESERGQLYQALFASHARRRVTALAAVVAGTELLLFDAHAPQRLVRRMELGGDAGPPRSIQRDPQSGKLLVGAARGVYLLDAEGAAIEGVYHAPDAPPVRGGCNAAALHGDNLIATHSELGVLHWRLGQMENPQALVADLTTGAKTVRYAQFARERFWCTVDDRIVSVPADDLTAAPHIVDTGRTVVSALCVSDHGIHVGNAEGDILRFDERGHVPTRLHGGSRRPAESVQLLTAGGVGRLYYTDTSLAVFGRVLGDAFVCRYEAGGQTIRRAEAAPDIVVGTTDARDRIIVWQADHPDRPSDVVNVAQLTGHSVQDVCLIPLAHTEC